MNKRQKIVCQVLILWLIGVTAIAISDYKTSDNNTPQEEVQVSELTMNGFHGVYNPIRETQNEHISEYTLYQTGDCQPIINYSNGVIVKNDTDEESVETEDVIETYESMEIPYGSTDSFMFMDYRAITDTSSKQWQLQQYAWTDWQGFRRIGDDYCVALGTFYGQVGDRFRITTDKGNVYSVTMADAKGYDSNGWYHVAGNGKINLVEFIVATECLPSEVTLYGDCGVLDNIGGNIVSVERID